MQSVGRTMTILPKYSLEVLGFWRTTSTIPYIIFRQEKALSLTSTKLVVLTVLVLISRRT